MVDRVAVGLLVVVLVIAARGVGDDMEHAVVLGVIDAVQRMKCQVQREHGDGQQETAHAARTQRTLSTPHGHHGNGTVSPALERGAG
jgi:hypothetical protein